MLFEHLPSLPVREVLADLTQALTSSRSAILIAPPGAGKTTLIPLALLQSNWLSAGQKIIMLEPRRLAARAAAERVAKLSGSKVGELVGYRMRMDSKISAQTRIEIVTEGVFTRMILNDPELNGIGCVVFDEFHERSLEADFGLALALETQSALREDLRVLVMSATLDGKRVSSLLGSSTPIIESKGRAYPVELIHVPREGGLPIEKSAANAVRRALRDYHGNILVFLPGRAEIERTTGLLADLGDRGAMVAPLYGAMDLKDQTLAIEPAPEGVRKIVLATAVAQTSITIEGVTIVIDSGFSREAVYEPRFQTTRLETVRVSRATAQQRAGRAGRTAPGVAIRLWHEGQMRALAPFDPPEIERTDLRRLLIDMTLWGVSDLATLPLLDQPPAATLKEAYDSLIRLGALDRKRQLTGLGKKIAQIALPVPLAAMISAATSASDAVYRAKVAFTIADLASTSRELDLEAMVRDLQKGRFGKRGHAVSQRALKLAGSLNLPKKDDAIGTVGQVLMDAFPDRVAMRRGAQAGSFLMANGRGVQVNEEHPLATEKFLLIVDVTGSAAKGRVTLAAPLAQRDIQQALAKQLEEIVALKPTENGGLSARREIRLGALTLSSTPEPIAPGEELEEALCGLVMSRGLGLLSLKDIHQALCARLNWLHRHQGAPWPDFSEDALLSTIHKWLKPFLAGKTSLAQLSSDELRAALLSRLPADLQFGVEKAAPETFQLPTGRVVRLRYELERANPVLSARVQELFGLNVHPSILNGSIPLRIEMLSPAQRPIQMTLDLPGFWAGSWADVRKEMRGRYPKHVWPEDPANASATDRAKPRK
ncbi:MAG: ATP-dependent helicase HrpB [Pseudomonadota bacterium]